MGEKSPALSEAGEFSSVSSINPAAENLLVRKIDLRLMPILFVSYFVAFLDRINISNALTLGLPQQLGLTGQQPNVALLIFFVPYVIFEIPSNRLMKCFTPHTWLAACIALFGIITIVQGFVKNYGGLLAVRFFLGLAEAGIFPGSFYIISFWYKREEAQRRFTFYWASVIVAGAFGGLLASAIAKMDGVSGLASWRWIFILEGLLTTLIGIASFFMLSDFPAQAKWLTDEEKKIVKARTSDDLAESEPVTLAAVLEFLKRPHAILGGLMYFSIVVPVYSFSYFTPTIILTLGLSTIETQLHSVPPFAASLGLCLVMAYLSDRWSIRFPFVIFGEVLMIVGLIILITVHGKDHFSVQYLGIHFTLMGSLGAGASIVCWYLMNLNGHKDRAIGSGWMISFGNTGGIIATFAFLKTDAPEYHTGYSILLGVGALGTAASILYALLVARERKKAATGSAPVPSL